MYKEHVKRCKDGWVAGYKIKTKMYSSDLTETIKESSMASYSNKNMTNHDKIFEDERRQENKIQSSSCNIFLPNKSEIHDIECDAEMCAVCILKIEDGDRVADLQCRHLYHADCLSEWVLKKVICFLVHMLFNSL